MASLEWQAGGPEFLLQFLHAPYRQAPTEERSHFRLPDMQEFRHRARIIAMTRQRGFQHVEACG